MMDVLSDKRNSSGIYLAIFKKRSLENISLKIWRSLGYDYRIKQIQSAIMSCYTEAIEKVIDDLRYLRQQPPAKQVD